jgi:transcription elongation factor GreA
MDNDFVLTKEGLEKLEAELKGLEQRKKEIIERLRDAKDYGDISENSEFDDAKNDQGFTERKINELRHIIKGAKVIDKKTCGLDKIETGCQIKLKSGDEEFIYTLVSMAESDPGSGKISIQSPVGQALLGKALGEIVEVNTPSGKIIKYEIIQID